MPTGLEDYVDTARLVDDNYDDPSLTNFDLLEQNILDLKAGRPAEAPVFDFASRERAGFRPVAMGDTRVLLVEGLYALNARVRPLLDLTVSINGGVHFDLIKRIQRDVGATAGATAAACAGAGSTASGLRGGDTPESIIRQICDTVFPMFKVRLRSLLPWFLSLLYELHSISRRVCPRQSPPKE